jgi:hypothetical protein
MKGYEEYHEWSVFWSWSLIIGVALFLLSMGMTMMYTVKDVPREWDFGNIEFTPAKSVYSTATPPKETSKKMIHALPEGKAISKKEVKEKK